MSKLKLFCDSSCDLSDEQLKEFQVTLVPLTIILGEEQYADRIEIRSEEFFQKIGSGKLTPRTSQPNFTQFEEAFRAADEEGADLLCITMSSNGSGTHASASLAAKNLEAEGTMKSKIYIFDSLSASIGVGFFVKKAAELAAQNKPILEILKELSAIRMTFGSYFFADTLEFLKRGGRVSTVSATFGTLLGIKPIIAIIEGFGRTFEKVKGEQNALRALAKIFADRHKNNEVYITHAGNRLGVERFLEEARNLCGEELHAQIEPIGCVLATHAGPGAIGIFFEQKMANIWPIPPLNRPEVQELREKIGTFSEQVQEKVHEVAEKLKK